MRDETHVGHHADLLADSLQPVSRRSNLAGAASRSKCLAEFRDRRVGLPRLLGPVSTCQRRGNRVVSKLGIVEHAGNQGPCRARLESLDQVEHQSPDTTLPLGIGDVGPEK